MMSKVLCLSLLILLFFNVSYAQDYNRCKAAQQLRFDDRQGLVPDKLTTDLYLNGKQQYVTLDQDAQTKSFWYGISFDSETDFQFLIRPLLEQDHFNFCVYKADVQADFCELLYTKNIRPVRTNLFKSSNALGLGISTDFADTNNTWGYTYNSNYQKALRVEKGSKYYINVYRVKGNACGYKLDFLLNNSVSHFISTQRKCNTESLHLLKKHQATSLKTPGVDLSKLKDLQSILLLYVQVFDASTKERINANLVYNDKGQRAQVLVHKNVDDAIAIDASTAHEFTFGSVGYIAKTLKQSASNDKISTKEIRIELEPVISGDKFNLDNIFFHAGTYAFKQEAQQTLHELLLLLEQRTELNIEIRGHTNGKGRVKKKKENKDKSKAYNFKGNEQKLSLMRAKAVKHHLVQRGIEANRIEVKGRGAEQMIFKRPLNDFQKDQNRRVEVYVK